LGFVGRDLDVVDGAGFANGPADEQVARVVELDADDLGSAEPHGVVDDRDTGARPDVEELAACSRGEEPWALLRS
jgi:hypothetical protein